MCRLGGAMIETKVVAASRLQAFMTKNLFDVANRAPIEQKLSCGGVAKQVSRDFLCYPGCLAIAVERSPNIWPFQTAQSIRCNKQRGMIIGAALDIPLDPGKRPISKENRSLLRSLAGDFRLGGGEVNVGPIKRQGFADPHRAAKKHFDQSAKAQAWKVDVTLPGLRLDGCNEALDFVCREIGDLLSRPARDQNRIGVDHSETMLFVCIP